MPRRSSASTFGRRSTSHHWPAGLRDRLHITLRDEGTFPSPIDIGNRRRRTAGRALRGEKSRYRAFEQTKWTDRRSGGSFQKGCQDARRQRASVAAELGGAQCQNHAVAAQAEAEVQVRPADVDPMKAQAKLHILRMVLNRRVSRSGDAHSSQSAQHCDTTVLCNG